VRWAVYRSWAELTGLPIPSQIPAPTATAAFAAQSANTTVTAQLRFAFTVYENQRWWMGLDWTAALLPGEGAEEAQPEDGHGLRLPDTMCPILSLPSPFAESASPRRHFSTRRFSIGSAGSKTTHLILVVKHDGSHRGEVDAEPTRMSAQKEESWGVWLVTALLETIHLRAAFQWARRTICADCAQSCHSHRP